MFDTYTEWNDSTCYYAAAFHHMHYRLLSGPFRTQAEAEAILPFAQEWALRASRVGLRTCPVRLSGRPPGRPADPLGDRAVVLVAAGAVFGPRWAAAVAEPCRALAADVGADLLEVRLDRADATSPTDGCFAGATTLPDLRRGGEAILDHLAQVLA